MKVQLNIEFDTDDQIVAKVHLKLDGRSPVVVQVDPRSFLGFLRMLIPTLLKGAEEVPNPLIGSPSMGSLIRLMAGLPSPLASKGILLDESLHIWLTRRRLDWVSFLTTREQGTGILFANDAKDPEKMLVVLTENGYTVNRVSLRSSIEAFIKMGSLVAWHLEGRAEVPDLTAAWRAERPSWVVSP